MAKYYLTYKAVDDLTEIWDYTIETWSEMQAEKYYDLLMASCDDLANNPELGRNYDIVTKGILGIKSGEHIIFYSIISMNEIEIARILDGMMDLKSRL
ncbi:MULTISPECIES: type II toxin-antitoxin system RelE/ParE family toxin [Flavobacterium]|uniref:type II toxin-antitoxin system RelE/ParE family toxin n=1 Tax=Flavobacterium TaxID=237 RepID=UPI0022AC3EB2|nr:MULTISPECIES: type II toxin-antitoxin system RelE/ParE family toxin [Flavobacterium]